MAIKIVQIGLGPLGRTITRHIVERPKLEITGAVDTEPSLAGRDLGELCTLGSLGIPVRLSIREALERRQADVAILSTVSDLGRIAAQVEEIIELGLSVVSTCEELAYPWQSAPELARRLDEAAKSSGVTVLATGVNPGFLMDTLPICLSAVSQRVDAIKVTRIQDASRRRAPFQRKIGAGLSLAEFEEMKGRGTLRHVGLTESMHMIAARIGWALDRVEDLISPVIADRDLDTETLHIEAGMAAGVQQIGRGFAGTEEKITLLFRASVGERRPEDTVEIVGEPHIVSTIAGGIHGDVATCAIVLNAIPQVLRAQPGLKTMIDIPPLAYFV